jgi:hypothetical protein
MDRLPTLHPVWTIVAAQALQKSKWNDGVENQTLRLLLQLAVSVSILVFPPYSVVSAFWRLAALLLKDLLPSLLLGSKLEASAPGPLGKGYGKLSTLAAAYILWSLAHRYHLIASPENPLRLGSWPPNDLSILVFIVVVLSTQANQVLSLWSHALQTRGNHQDVELMVDSMPARLNWRQHRKLLGLALVNAVCEEGESRGFWRSEYQLAGLDRTQSNFAQAFFFGIWHYHGIPSGVSGVCLAFVYGVLMGYLQDCGSGLFLPILAHTIADYYIFAHLAKRQVQRATAKRTLKT